MVLPRRQAENDSETTDLHELTLAQWRALSRQVPLMYAMLIVNTVTLAITHLSSTPWPLAIAAPVLLCFFALVRAAAWLRHRGKAVSLGQARSSLRTTIWAAIALSIGFSCWSLSLYGYGDAYQQSHIAFYMGITTIGCMLCLMHVRLAALCLGAFVIVPFTAYFALTGQVTFLAIAINMAIVVAVVAVILIGYNRGFSELVGSRTQIALRQQETQRLLDENHRLANLDSLTGIANRRSFERELRSRFDAARQAGREFGVSRINLDRFRAVNEIFGQITGDAVMVEIARRITAIKRESTFLARLDGDNFALIFDAPVDQQALEHCGRRVLDAIAQPFDMPLGTVHITASMGFAASTDEESAESLFDHADYATWVAKRGVRGPAVVFSADDASELRQTRQMEHLLHTADLDDELYILLQPQFDMSQGVTTGFEVLARWRSPVLGEVSPAEFIPMAERTGCISRITQTVLRKALAVSAALPAHQRLSVNLSAHDISSTTAIKAIVAQVEASKAPCRIDFEVTETALMRDFQQAREGLVQLLALGARISLDDFGTGHSSLTHVQKLPLHRIKVDRSFVADVGNDPKSRAIVKTIIDLCRNLGLGCVFEGIETTGQLEVLVGMGGSIMQGYLFGRPMSVEQVMHYLDQENARGAPVRRRGTTQ